MMNSPIPSQFRPVIALMTDFGLGDGDVGIMKGVIAGITPQAHIIDITHDIAPQNVPSAAWILATAYHYFPANTVFVCVIDPGVGSSRGAIAVHAGNWFFVGPDNGLFTYILQEQPVHTACLLSNPAYHLSYVSSTFHGRDIFAPVGAYLANGIPISEMGTPLEPSTLQRINIEPPTRHGTDIDARIIHVDNFGNLITNVPLPVVPDLFDAPKVQVIFPAGRVVDRRRRFFAGGPDDGQPFIYADSSGYVGIAVRNGNAARMLGVKFGAPITFVIANK